jgi:hypothetical protein
MNSKLLKNELTRIIDIKLYNNFTLIIKTIIKNNHRDRSIIYP